MKTIKLLVIMMLAITSMTFAQDRVVPYSQVPSPIKNYITKHFPTHSVLKAEIDREVFAETYEIDLSEGVELKFNSKNHITKISGKSKLPNSVISKKVLDYVASNYPNNVITEWEMDGKKQQVELDNDINLEFKKNGEFIRIDR